MQNLTLGFAMTGSFCTLAEVIEELESLAMSGAHIIPILSEAVAKTDTRFGKAADWMAAVCDITGAKPILTIEAAEPIGPKKLLDALIVAPCTGNTLSKIANGITDSCVTMAAKAHLRNERPLILSIATNDGLSGSAPSLGKLFTRRHVYFVSFGQDDPGSKPTSLIAHTHMLQPTLEEALKGRQIQPLLSC